MAETSFIPLVPNQAAAVSLPYEVLWRSAYDLMSPESRKKFGNANALQQSRAIAKMVNGDMGPALIKNASKLMSEIPSYRNNTNVLPDAQIDALTADQINSLRGKAISDLVKRGKSLSSMSAKALDAQKLKETMGVGSLSDDEYLRWLENQPLERTEGADKPARGQRYSTPDKFNAQARTNKSLMDVPENHEGDYKQSGFNYLINKKAYYDKDNWKQRYADKVLSFVPLPFASQAAIARQEGEIAPHETGLDNPRVFVGGSLNALAMPMALLPGGPAISGGFIALGNSLAKGKSAENGAIDVAKDVTIGAATGAASKALGDFAASKLPFFKNMTKKGQAEKAYNTARDNYLATERATSEAEEAYRNLMAPMIEENGMVVNLNPMESKSLVNAANSAYTAKVNKAIQSGKLSGVDADAFDPNRVGEKYIVIPTEIWKNDAALKEATEATKAAAERTAALKEFNRTQSIKPNQWLDVSLDEGGYNPAIKKARDLFVREYGEVPKFTEGPIDWKEAMYYTPTKTMEMVASKPIYPFGNKRQRTLSQSIFKALGYDKAGKGAQKATSGTAPQFDVNMQIMKNMRDKDLKEFINTNYAGNPKNLARDVYSQADSYVQEAYNNQIGGTLTPERLQGLAEEYASWHMPANAKPEEADYYIREFLAKLNQLRRNPDKVPFEYKPYTTIPAQLNQGVDVTKGISSGKAFNYNTAERPNPSLAAQFTLTNGDPEKHITLLAHSMDKQNRGLAQGPLDPNNPSYSAMEQALAYYGDLENPSKEAVSKAISRADAAKLDQVNRAYETMKGSFRIPTALEAQQAEANVIKAKMLEAAAKKQEASNYEALKNVDKFEEVPMKWLGKIKPFKDTKSKKIVRQDIAAMVTPGIFSNVATSTEGNMSLPESQTYSQEVENETSRGASTILRKAPWIGPLLYRDEAKKRGNYMPESNLDYVVPDVLISR